VNAQLRDKAHTYFFMFTLQVGSVVSPVRIAVMRPTVELNLRITDLSFTWLGHATLILQSAGDTRMIFDPFVRGNPSTPDEAEKQIGALDLEQHDGGIHGRQTPHAGPKQAQHLRHRADTRNSFTISRC
jgi:hypothetical protein